MSKPKSISPLRQRGGRPHDPMQTKTDDRKDRRQHTAATGSLRLASPKEKTSSPTAGNKAGN